MEKLVRNLDETLSDNTGYSCASDKGHYFLEPQFSEDSFLSFLQGQINRQHGGEQKLGLKKQSQYP